MNIGSIIVFVILLLVVALAVFSIWKDRKAGRKISCGDCKACNDENGVCPSERWVVDLAKDLEQTSEDLKR